MHDYIDGWENMHRRDIEAARAAFDASPDRDELIAEASRRGFRRPTLSEQMYGGMNDLYLWRGRVWVRANQE